MALLLAAARLSMCVRACMLHVESACSMPMVCWAGRGCVLDGRS